MFDSVTHVTPDGRWFHTAFDATEERLIREMGETGVRQAVVVALAEFIPNDFVLEVCRRHRGKLFPGGSFNPARYASPAEAAREYQAAFTGYPFSLVKLHPRLNRYDPLDSRCLAVLDAISSAESPLPVWIDSLLYNRHVILKKPPVDTFHELACRYPSVPFVILHSCGSCLLQLADSLRDCPNATLDLSFTLTRCGQSSLVSDIRHLVSTFDRRLIFGSDFPEFGLKTAIDAFLSICGDLDADRVARVLQSNLQAIIRER